MKKSVLGFCSAVGLMLATAGSPVANAHSPLKQSVPQNGAVVASGSAPKHLELQFAHDLRLTSVSLRRGKGTVALKPLPEAASTHRLPLPPLGPGEYAAEWRGMATDGHVMSGVVRFSVTSR